MKTNSAQLTRVAFLSLSPSFGMNFYLADLANCIAHRHTVSVITTSQAGHDLFDPAVSVLQSVNVDGTSFSLSNARLDRMLRIVNALRHWKPDVIHITSPHIWNVPLTILLRTVAPVIVTLHDPVPHIGQKSAWMVTQYNRLLPRLADKVLLHGECFREMVGSLAGDPAKIATFPLTHIPGGVVELRDLDARIERGEIRKPEGHTVLFVGRMEPYKGIDVLVEAARLAESHGSTIDVVIAGPGEHLFTEPLPQNVRLLPGFVDSSRLIDLFEQATVVVLPYIQATQSALISTAYALGRPVVVTDVGALAEYVVPGQTGSVVPPNDPQALEAALVRLVNDVQQLSIMSERALSWYRSARLEQEQKLTELYDEMSSRGAG